MDGDMAVVKTQEVVMAADGEEEEAGARTNMTVGKVAEILRWTMVGMKTMRHLTTNGSLQVNICIRPFKCPLQHLVRHHLSRRLLPSRFLMQNWARPK